MSFNRDVKAEIVKHWSERTDEKETLAFVAAFVRAGSLYFVKHRIGVEISTDTDEVALHYISRMKEFGLDSELSVVPATKDRAKKFVVRTSCAEKLLEQLKILTFEGGSVVGIANLAPDSYNTAQRRAYLTGMFLGAGSVFVPDNDIYSKTNGYHLEIVLQSSELAKQLQVWLKAYHIAAGVAMRRKQLLLYVKESQIIADMLALFGASDAVLGLQSIVALKSAKNEENRKNNCTIANMQKTVDASLAQIAAIERLVSSVGLGTLPAELREVASLRLANPEASLAELAEGMSEPISRSGIRHRLNKIVAMANDLPKT